MIARDRSAAVEGSAMDQQVAELGLASTILGAMLFLASPITLILAVQVWRFADQTPQVVLLHAWLARIGAAIGLLSAMASVAFGIQGVCLARRRVQSAALAHAGTFISSASLALWIITGIALLNTTESLLRLYGT